MALVGFVVRLEVSTRGARESGVDGPGELDVQRVTGLPRVDAAVQGPAEQRQVADEVQDLVADELVAEPQGPGHDAAVVENDRVVEAAAPRQAAGAQGFDLAGEPEGARGRDARRELLRPQREGQRLACRRSDAGSRSRT